MTASGAVTTATTVTTGEAVRTATSQLGEPVQLEQQGQTGQPGFMFKFNITL